MTEKELQEQNMRYWIDRLLDDPIKRQHLLRDLERENPETVSTEEIEREVPHIRLGQGEYVRDIWLR